jgi:hypothetical protein
MVVLVREAAPPPAPAVKAQGTPEKPEMVVPFLAPLPEPKLS